LPHLWPTCSSSGSPPLITARYFSSDSSDSGSLRTPCPPPACTAGRQGITPAFGYSAPHPSAGGTLTLLTHTLPSTHYEPLRIPTAPGLSLAGVRLIIPDHVVGPPVLRTLSLCTCRRHYPGTAAGRTTSLISPAVSAFPERVVGSACASSFSRLARRSHALRPAHSRCHQFVTR